MSKNRRDDRDKKPKKRFRSDGTSVWSRPAINGPGIWIACVKGKERQAIGENYDLFESIAEELWPTENVSETRPSTEGTAQSSEDDDGDEIDIEKAIAKEVENMKRPRKDKLFSSRHTDTPCLIFMSCMPSVDPVKLIMHHVDAVERTGIPRTRATQRYVPISASCDANLAEIASLCRKVVVPAFPGHLLEDMQRAEDEGKIVKYKIELRSRNHNTVTRDDAIKTIAACIPPQHVVDLSNPELFILIELFKATCGISVVRDYYRLKKFNVVELAQAKAAVDGEGTGAV